MDMSFFYLLAIVNNVTMNMGIKIFVRVPAFTSFGYLSRCGSAGSDGNSTFNSFEDLYHF